MDFEVKQAKREKVWTKIALMGPSGSGKTYSSLRLAEGMLKKLEELGQQQNDKILMMNTEASRGLYYADEFNYDIANIIEPYTPERYIEAIDFALENEYPILILDSTTHEWNGAGGALEIHAKAGGRYQDWNKVTPRHDAFLEKIADSEIHILATMRGKDQYELSSGETGGLNIKKIGVGAKQREGFEYEFTATFLLDQATNTAQTTKDNTHIFETSSALLLSEQHGKELIEWANSGEGFTPTIRRRKTKKDLAEYASSQGLSPMDIAKALEEKNLVFDNNPDVWPQLEEAIKEYADKLELEEEEN
jgi:hypothetical protein